ncbi:MAG: indole-3-glycerol phosphate synthase TrpC [Myxococcota bacterium]
MEGDASTMGYLEAILARKRVEVRRRASHGRVLRALGSRVADDPERRRRAVAALRRGPGQLPRVIAEVKFRSPSAGPIRPHQPGDGPRIARAYVRGGAAAVSVLADGPGFGGSVLEVRRVAGTVEVPVLFKEFVLDPVQVPFARAAGASLVLLLVRALEDDRLHELVAAVRSAGMEPVVEAADAAEVDRALATEATVVGVNARDLRTFQVDAAEAARCLARVPDDRVAVYMSGIRGRADLMRLKDGRADAVLVGEGLMRAENPEETLGHWLGGS